MKRILATMAAICFATIGSAAIADPTPPDFIHLLKVTVGHAEGDVAPVTFEGKTGKFQVVNCEVKWDDGEEFYVLTTAKARYPLMVKKTYLDFAWEATHDWDASLAALQKDSDLCILMPAKATI